MTRSKTILVITFLATLSGSLQAIAQEEESIVDTARTLSMPLRVSEDGRRLVDADAQPFFWLGDTAWNLFSRTTWQEADLYLQNRASKGFTVIQAVILGLGSDFPENRYGDPPLLKDDDGTPDTDYPNEAYFSYIDRVVDRAEELGVVVGLLPVWGRAYVHGDTCVFEDPQAAYRYGRFLGQRYGGKALVWILGGDSNPEGHEEIWEAMAGGLADGDNGRNLATFHPGGGGRMSGAWLHGEEWLDFNMIQSGHSAQNRNYEMIAAESARIPTKPVVEGEPGYENIPESLRPPGPDVPKLEAIDVRRSAYLSLLAGAAGFTYGCNEVYQFWEEGMKADPWGAEMPWAEALDLPGAEQMRHVRKLFQSRDSLNLAPDSTIAAGDVGSTVDRIGSAVSPDRSSALIYTASGREIVVRTGAVVGDTLRAAWYDPRTGDTQEIGEFPAEEMKPFKPSTKGTDWVLILDGSVVEMLPEESSSEDAVPDPDSDS